MKSILRFNKGYDFLSKITQKEGEGTHSLNFANDFNGNDASCDTYLLAPFDCVVRAISRYDNTVFFESTDVVETPIGLTKAWFMCTHMNDAYFNELGVRVGRVYKQNERCFHEGVKGIGSGSHIHFQCGVGGFTGTGTYPYYWDGRYITFNGTKAKNYAPYGVERHLNEVFFLPNDLDASNLTKVYKFKKVDEKGNSPRTFIVKGTYKTLVPLRVRVGAGTQYQQKTYSQLSVNARLHAFSKGVNAGCLKVGTPVTCLEIKELSNSTWIRIPSGWICAKLDGTCYLG